MGVIKVNKKTIYTLAALVGFVVLLGLSNAFGRQKHPTTTKAVTTTKMQKLTLEAKNTLVLRSVVTDDSVKDVQRAAIAMSSQLSANDTIYLFLDTPGGSVDAGMNMISSLQAIPQKVTTITKFAASMGAITVEALGDRLMLPNSVLMFHRAYGGTEGQIPGQLNTRVQFFTDSIVDIEKTTATRMGLSLKDYEALIKDEHWVFGQKAIDENAADKMVLVNCAADLQGTYVQTIQTFFGNVFVTWSSCPTISAPINIDFGKMDYSLGSAYEVDKAKRTIYEGLTNKVGFLEDSVLRNNYLTLVK